MRRKATVSAYCIQCMVLQCQSKDRFSLRNFRASRKLGTIQTDLLGIPVIRPGLKACEDLTINRRGTAFIGQRRALLGRQRYKMV